jgi:hypothetical protein
VKQFGKRCVVGVLLVAMLTSVSAQCESLNDDVDPIVRRARSKQMRWALRQGASDRAAVRRVRCPGPRATVDSTSWAAHDSDWIEVSGDRVGKRHALVARFTNDRWDNTVGVCDLLDTGTLGSFHETPQPVGRRASGRSCRPSGRSATAELDQLCNPKWNSTTMRCEHEVGIAGV